MKSAFEKYVCNELEDLNTLQIWIVEPEDVDRLKNHFPEPHILAGDVIHIKRKPV